jgi:hypothetical protein
MRFNRFRGNFSGTARSVMPELFSRMSILVEVSQFALGVALHYLSTNLFCSMEYLFRVRLRLS